jgi:hypothetical protein
LQSERLTIGANPDMQKLPVINIFGLSSCVSSLLNACNPHIRSDGVTREQRRHLAYISGEIKRPASAFASEPVGSRRPSDASEAACRCSPRDDIFTADLTVGPPAERRIASQRREVGHFQAKISVGAFVSDSRDPRRIEIKSAANESTSLDILELREEKP